MISVDPVAPAPEAIAEAAAVLRAGGLVAFPTETVYGLGARALDAAAVRAVFEAKGRPPGHPLIAHVLDEAGARRLSREWTDRASRLARAFWPGPLTLIVPRSDVVPPDVTGGGEGVGVRAPRHPVARALIAALGRDEAIAAPSANRYQSLSPTTAAHVLKSLAGRVDLVLDGGSCDAGIESTVVDARGDVARVLRPGAVGVAELRAVEPDLEVVAAAVAEGAERASPGLDVRHYAPRARLVVADSRDAALRAAAAARGEGARAGVVLRGEPPAADALADVITLPDDAKRWEASLFATLHALDDAGCDVIVVERPPPDDEAWLAVADRLRRGGG